MGGSGKGAGVRGGAQGEGEGGRREQAVRADRKGMSSQERGRCC